MVAFVCVVIASLLVHAEDFVDPDPADPLIDGPYYNCSKVTPAADPAACIATGYCVWATNQCIYDKCIKYVPDDGGNPCPSQIGGTVGGVECELYYITDIIDCNNGNPIQTDRYCRTKSAAYQKSGPFDKCFFDDLKSRETNGGATSCGNKWCQLTTVNSNTGTYCKQIGLPSENDCSLAYGNLPFFCDCLGPDHCNLHPDCMVSSNKCIQDPCSLATGGASAGVDCLNYGSAQNCVTKRRQKVVNNAIQDSFVCSSSTNNKANECFFAYNYTVVHNPTYPSNPECDTLQQNLDVCGLAYTFKSDGTNDPDKKCALEPIAAGYFPFNQYCNDGERTVPSPDAASVSRAHLFLLAAIFSLLYFL